MRKSPCHGCGKRFVGCHSECLEYIDFVQKNDADREEINRQKRIDKLSKFSGYSYSSRRRLTDTQRQARKNRPVRPSQKG